MIHRDGSSRRPTIRPRVQRWRRAISLAEDAAQNVFLKVHRAAHQLDCTRDPAAWLVQITYNTCRDHWRSRAWRMAQRTISWESMQAQEDEPSALEDGALRIAREREVRTAISQLPEDWRAIVVFHDYQGMPHEEIASVLGISHTAVRKRYSRALRRLAEQLTGRLE